MDYANIILEMLDRIKKLELEVSEIKKQNEKAIEERENNNFYIPKMSLAKPDDIPKTTKRDTTRYMFEGQIYLKNRLVLAVVKKYVNNNPEITRSKLKEIFSKSLQGSMGVVENSEIALLRKDCDVRFFTKPNEIIHLCDGDMYVCSQWGILNIPNFLAVAKNLGYNIESI